MTVHITAAISDSRQRRVRRDSSPSFTPLLSQHPSASTLEVLATKVKAVFADETGLMNTKVAVGPEAHMTVPESIYRRFC